MQGEFKTDQAKKVKALEQETAQLQRLLADTKLGKAMLREVASGTL